MQTHPERLLGEKVGVPTPRPQTARAKPASGVILGPCETCTRPVSAWVVRPVLPRVEGELLVVRSELPREKSECSQCQDAICERQRSGVGRGDERGGGDEE
jgi:hypothetical protein